MEWIYAVIAALLGLAIGGAVGYFFRQQQYQQQMGNLEAMRKRLLEESEKQAREIVLAARDESYRLREEADKELETRRTQLRQEEERLQRRREQLDQRQEQMDRKEQTLNKRQSTVDKRWNELEKLEAQRREELERVANLSTEEARNILLEQVAQETRQDMARVIREEEFYAQEEAERRARQIITTAVQRIAGEQVAELTTKTIEIPSDELKGRIIGRGGRNIR
ncbi:MAG TPA: Rnase Y domain-containing protein, partial [Anaerolineae bacterium]|nr:Rnase Y domain-containing protein [Anaerolineae bacterium]